MSARPEQPFPATLASTPHDMLETLGFVRISAWNPEKREVELSFECRPNFCHSGGRVAQGGFVTAWLDASMAHAVMLASGETQTIASLDINVRFLEPVGPGPVRARGRIVRMGRRVAVLEARLCAASDDRLLATATSSGMLLELGGGD